MVYLFIINYCKKIDFFLKTFKSRYKTNYCTI